NTNDAFAYDYEMSFQNNFDQLVFEQSIPEEYATTELKDIVTSTLGSMETVLQLHSGIKRFTSYVDHLGKRFRITLIHD
ncbi:hypothetical protein EB077_13095, partial [bacterium]|nr:hypothetical protein [bacterium]